MSTDAPRFVLVTGLSGAGKGQALRFLEDLGYYCVDNLPVQLISTFADLVAHGGPQHSRIAICVDARAREGLLQAPAYLDEVQELGLHPDVLFLDSSDKTLLQRYSESRRRHPSSPTGSIEEGIRRERELLEPLRGRADLIIDTSATSVQELRERIATVFRGGKASHQLVITVLSFGFKYGVPQESDLLFDVRFLPNPHYDAELKTHTGNEPDVRDFVLDNDDARQFFERVRGLLKFLLPCYSAEPKSYLTIGVGCTGGRHRSVAVAHELALFLRELKYDARLRHRDVAHSD